MYSSHEFLFGKEFQVLQTYFVKCFEPTRYLGFSITVLDKMRNVKKSMIKEIYVWNV